MITGGFVAPPTVSPEPGFFVTLYQREQDRITNCAKYWRAYHGIIDPSKVNPDDPINNWNFVRKFVDVGVYFLVGGGFTSKVKKPFIGLSLPIVNETWKVNHRDKFAYAAAQTGSVTGDWFAMVAYDEPSALERQIRPYSKGQIRYKLFGSEQVFCQWDPLDRTTLVSVRIETYFYAASDGPVSQVPSAMQRHTLTITRHTISSQVQGEQPKITPNVLGEIPVVHCKNLELAGEYYGLSDITDLLPLVDDLNEKTTDVSNSINANGVPTVALFGAKAKALDKEPTTFWSGLPEKARIDVIRLGQEDLGGATSYIKELEKTLYVLAGVPEAVLGGQMAISNTSGVAIQMVYQPLTMKREAKRIQFEAALERLEYFTLRYAAILGQWNPPYDMCSCGGRIVEVETGKTIDQWDQALETYVSVPERRKKCYCVDPQTLEFQTPKDVVVKALLDYGVASHVGELRFEDVNARAREGKKSFWAMAVKDTAEEGVAVPRIPVEEFPAEPETVTVVRKYISPTTGELVKETRERMLLVPTGCCSPEYLNPFETEVSLGEVIPKDDAVLGQFLTMAQTNGWVDKEFCQDQFPKIAAEKHAINARIKRHQAQEAEEVARVQQDMAPPDTSESSVEGKQAAQERQSRSA